MNRSALRAAALVLPLLGLAGTWAYTHVRAQQGTEWDVPIAGYDPRDLLRGHYVQFQYDWPTTDLADPETTYGMLALCIEGSAPNIKSTRIKHYTETCDRFVREGAGFEGRLYASQAEALRLEEKLRDRTLQGIVRIRLRDDGHITPLRITFRPRPQEPEDTGDL